MEGWVTLILLCPVSVMVIILNIICIYVILKTKALLQRASTILISSLLMIHLLQALLVIPFYALKRNVNKTNRSVYSVVCDGFRLFYLITFYMVCFNVQLITVDRYLAIKLATSYTTKIKRSHYIVALAAMWAYVVSLCIIPYANPKSKCNYNPQKRWVVFMLSVNCALPFFAIIIIYIYIVTKLRAYSGKLMKQSHYKSRRMESNRLEKKVGKREEKNVGSTSHDNTDNNNSLSNNNTSNKNSNLHDGNFADTSHNKQRTINNIKISLTNKRITRNTMLLVTSYALAWTPSIIYYILQTMTPSLFPASYYNSPAEEYVSFFLKYIKFVEGIISPMLYCYLSGHLKRIKVRCRDNKVHTS